MCGYLAGISWACILFEGTNMECIYLVSGENYINEGIVVSCEQGGRQAG